MAEEFGLSSKLGQVLPLDPMKDSGGKVPNQEGFLRKRRKKMEEQVSEERGQEEHPPQGGEESPAGKIVDIII